MSRRPTARPIPTALQAWPATQTTLMRVADLLPYARNARTHSPEQVEQIVASIREFGFTNPVLVDEANNIIAGHGRVMALKEMGHEQVPVMVARGWSEAQRRAYVLADNKLALNAGWDEALLALEIKDLQGLGFDLSLTGFSSLEISALFPEQRSAEDEAADQDAPEVPPIPTSQRGDTWILGRHRIRCGDSTVREDVAALLADAKPHLMVTDPPYGVSYDAD